MSVLRKEEPSPATDVASQRRASATPATTGATTAKPVTDRADGMDGANIDPAARRPPQSVATPVTDDTSDRAIDDTYDGEIVSSSIDETDETQPRSTSQQPGVPRASQNPARAGCRTPSPIPAARILAIRPARIHVFSMTKNCATFARAGTRSRPHS